jgi:hypothetical protein
MMVTTRTPLLRTRTHKFTEEMIGLFKRGLEIVRAGDDQRWEDDRPPGRRREYLDIEKRLNIVLMRKGWHEVSVLDPMLDRKMPAYMRGLASGSDWHISAAQRQALLEELRHLPPSAALGGAAMIRN